MQITRAFLNQSRDDRLHTNWISRIWINYSTASEAKSKQRSKCRLSKSSTSIEKQILGYLESKWTKQNHNLQKAFFHSNSITSNTIVRLGTSIPNEFHIHGRHILCMTNKMLLASLVLLLSKDLLAPAGSINQISHTKIIDSESWFLTLQQTNATASFSHQ